MNAYILYMSYSLQKQHFVYCVTDSEPVVDNHYLFSVYKETIPLWISIAHGTSWSQWLEDNEQAFIHRQKRSNEGVDKIANDPITTYTRVYVIK